MTRSPIPTPEQAERIIAMRREGISQEDIADALGLFPPAVARVEHGAAVKDTLDSACWATVGAKIKEHGPIDWASQNTEALNACADGVGGVTTPDGSHAVSSLNYPGASASGAFSGSED